MTRIQKLLRMPRRELAWRATAALRIQHDRVQWRLRRPAWDRTALLRAVDREAVGSAALRHLERCDWRAAAEALATRLRQRPSTFVLDPSMATELAGEILRRWPGAAADAAARADRIVSGTYDVLGYRRLTFCDDAGRLDWHFDPVHGRRAPLAFWADVPYLDASVGDHKIIWELNRHQHWLALGRALWLTRDQRYAREVVSQLEEWLEANPPLTGINWASALELALRALSWTWAIHFLIGAADDGGGASGEWLIDALVGLDAQLRHVEQNLSYYFSPNTHLTGEALALYVCGLSFPELDGGRRWHALGRRILLDEIDRQICADGGHAERSTHYHRYTLDFYLMALLAAERAQDAEAIARFSDAVVRAAGFARTMADDAGRLPLIGDDDGGMLVPIAGRGCENVRDSLALAAVVLARPDLAPWGLTEEVFWLAGATAVEQEPFVEAHRLEAQPAASRTLIDTGFIVMRDDGSHLVFDVGPHGYQNGGHAHADALAINLTLKGCPLLVDPGTSAYTIDPSIRDRMRSTASHNTLTLDRQPASRPSGAFQWHTRTDAHAGAIRHNGRFDWAEGWHDGYENRHRRTVVRTPAGLWLVVDEVLGRGAHSADVHWHFDPAWIVSVESPTEISAVRFDRKQSTWLVHDAAETTLLHGDEPTGLGWFAPAYGTLLPTWTARASRRGIAPFSIVTCVAATTAPPSLERIAAEHDPGGSDAIAVRVRHDAMVSIAMVRPGEHEARDGRGCGVADYHTDARLLHYSIADGRLRVLAACDAHHVLALRDGWLSVASDEPMHDICIELRDGQIDAWSSSPVRRVKLQGGAMVDATRVRLNGRALPRHGRDRADSAIAFASDWGEPGRLAACAASPASQI